jgi:hypothetical protein
MLDSITVIPRSKDPFGSVGAIDWLPASWLLGNCRPGRGRASVSSSGAGDPLAK